MKTNLGEKTKSVMVNETARKAIQNGTANAKLLRKGEKLGYSGRTIERMKSIGLTEFAEAYNSGELLSYKK